MARLCRIFELDAGTVIDTNALGEMTIAEWERLVRGRRDGGALRCSGSFHDETRKRTGQPPDQLGPLRARRPRLHDGGDVASA